MAKKILYATSNAGKMQRVRDILEPYGLDVVSPREIGLPLVVLEIGATLEENATQKARAYLDQLNGDDYVVIADHTGVSIDALNGEPGVHVRNWIGRQMGDQEIIANCLTRMAQVPAAGRSAHFHTMFAVGTRSTEIELFDGTLDGTILEEAEPIVIEGFPFESLFYVPEWQMSLGEAQRLPVEQREQYVTHREQALKSALRRLKELVNGN